VAKKGHELLGLKGETHTVFKGRSKNKLDRGWRVGKTTKHSVEKEEEYWPRGKASSDIGAEDRGELSN